MQVPAYALCGVAQLVQPGALVTFSDFRVQVQRLVVEDGADEIHQMLYVATSFRGGFVYPFIVQVIGTVVAAGVEFERATVVSSQPLAAADWAAI